MIFFWLTAEMPSPPNTGGRIVMYKRIEYFSRQNEIFLFSIIDSEEDRNYQSDMEKYCREVRLYNRKEKKNKNLLKLFKGPYVCTSRWQKCMKDDIDKMFDDIKPDYIMVDFPQMLGNISNKVFKSGNVVLNQHNTEYQTLRNLSGLYSSWPMRIASKIESYRLQLLEKEYYSKNLIKLYTFLSIEDKAFFEKKYGLTNTYLVPIGTEVIRLAEPEKKDFIISYIGKMEYLANAEASVWFANNVYSKLKSHIPNLKYFIVGKNPLESVVSLSKNDKNIVVTGTVSDMKAYFEQSDIIVIPLFHGGGVKVKLLEALGYGKLVITTPKGVEGTVFTDKKELLVAATSNEFVDLCLDVYKIPEKYSSIRECGFKRIQDEFTWESIIKNFEGKLKSMKN